MEHELPLSFFGRSRADDRTQPWIGALSLVIYYVSHKRAPGFFLPSWIPRTPLSKMDSPNNPFRPTQDDPEDAALLSDLEAAITSLRTLDAKGYLLSSQLIWKISECLALLSRERNMLVVTTTFTPPSTSGSESSSPTPSSRSTSPAPSPTRYTTGTTKLPDLGDPSATTPARETTSSSSGLPGFQRSSRFSRSLVRSSLPKRLLAPIGISSYGVAPPVSPTDTQPTFGDLSMRRFPLP